jgi:hypothetical protein
MWRVGETIRSGNSTGTVKSYDEDTKFIVITNINGSFESGDFVTGDDSGASGILNNFSIEQQYDSGFSDTSWDKISDIAITQDDGSYVAIDEHFDGTPSQDYRTEKIVII